MNRRGLTLIELLVAIVLLVAVSSAVFAWLRQAAFYGTEIRAGLQASADLDAVVLALRRDLSQAVASLPGQNPWTVAEDLRHLRCRSLHRGEGGAFLQDIVWVLPAVPGSSCWRGHQTGAAWHLRAVALFDGAASFEQTGSGLYLRLHEASQPPPRLLWALPAATSEQPQ